MIRVVLDTNVLVSGTYWTGASFKVLDLVDRKVVISILSKEILDEYSRVCLSDEIIDKVRRHNLHILKSIEKIIMNSIIVAPKMGFSVIKDDIDDNKVINAAVEGRTNYIITQDNHLLKLREFKGIRIVTPKEFLNSFDNKL